MAGDTSDVERLIEGLVSDERYAELSQTRPGFDLFEILGGLTENPSSRVLAFLSDSGERHGLGTAFYDALLRELHRAGADAGRRFPLRELLRFQAGATVCTTEWATPAGRRLDILVENYAADGKLKSVLGVENKHWAGEQDDQVSDYQSAIRERFKDVPTAVLFLAPGERMPTTAGDFEDCPCVPCSYGTVVNALAAVEGDADGDVGLLVSNLRRHFDRALEGGGAMNERVRELVRELYRDENHRVAIRNIVENLPRFGFLAERIVDEASERVKKSLDGDKFESSFYPQKDRERLCEIKLVPVELARRTKGHGFEIIYVLRAWDRGPGGGPDIGHEISGYLMAWLGDPGATAGFDSWLKTVELPQSSGQRRRWYSQWRELWCAGKYKLDDLGERDIAGCVGLFEKVVRETYGQVREAVERLDPA